jgi:hypothetical protein
MKERVSVANYRFICRHVQHKYKDLNYIKVLLIATDIYTIDLKFICDTSLVITLRSIEQIFEKLLKFSSL